MQQTFLAEIHEVKSTKQVSNDVEIRVVFKTHQYDVLDLGKLPGDKIVRVTVEQIPEHTFGESRPVKMDKPLVKNEANEHSPEAENGGGDPF